MLHLNRKWPDRGSIQRFRLFSICDSVNMTLLSYFWGSKKIIRRMPTQDNNDDPEMEKILRCEDCGYWPSRGGSVLVTNDGGKTWKQNWAPCNFEVWCIEAPLALYSKVLRCGGASTECACFDHADLSDCLLIFDNIGGKTDIDGASFRSAVLYGANLEDVSDKETDFTGALHNELTRFREGFDPGSHGMILK